MLTILISGVVSGQCNPEIQDCSESFDFSSCATSDRQGRIEALEELSYGYVTVTHTVSTYEGYRVAQSITYTGRSGNISTVTPSIKIEDMLETDFEALKSKISGYVLDYQRIARIAKIASLDPVPDDASNDLVVSQIYVENFAIPTYVVTVWTYSGADSTGLGFDAVDYGNGSLKDMTVEEFNAYYEAIRFYIYGPN